MHSYSYDSPLNKKSKQIKKLSSLLKLFSDTNRLKVLHILYRKEHCVCEIMEHVNMSQSLISHHLKNLRKEHIVIDEKRGLRVYYALTKKGNFITNLLFQIPKKI